jgi:hypothetical protein
VRVSHARLRPSHRRPAHRTIGPQPRPRQEDPLDGGEADFRAPERLDEDRAHQLPSEDFQGRAFLAEGAHVDLVRRVGGGNPHLHGRQVVSVEPVQHAQYTSGNAKKMLIRRDHAREQMRRREIGERLWDVAEHRREQSELAHEVTEVAGHGNLVPDRSARRGSGSDP